MSHHVNRPSFSIVSLFRVSLFRTLLIAATLTSLLVSCGPKVPNRFASLLDAGMIAVSSSSPTVGANLFLAEQMEKSNNMYGFLESQGSPNALALRDRRLGKYEVYMYYWPDQVYIGERVDSEASTEWIIRGPRGITRNEFLTLRDLRQRQQYAGLFQVFGSQVRFPYAQGGGGSRQTARNQPEPVIPRMPSPSPSPKRRKVIKRTPTPIPSAAAGSEATPSATPKPSLRPQIPDVPKLDPRNYQALNTDQRALLLARGFAERADNGDIAHTVTKDSRTLTEIAKWYTGNADNVTQVAQANGIEPTTPLKAGMRILVPLAMVKEFKKLK